MKRGKKANHWDYLRRTLKKQFLEMGIVTCEVCGSSNYLSFAHRVKRRFITTDEELRIVALLCVPCHAVIEHSGHTKMFDSINEIIEKRCQRSIEFA